MMTGSSVSAAGEVNVALPSSPAETFDLLGGCTFSGTRSMTSVSTDLAQVLVFTGPDELLGQIAYVRKSDGLALTHMYSSQAATFNGTAICGSTTLNLNLNLQTGWNMVAATGDDQSLSLSSVTDPAGVSMALIKANESLTLSSSDNSTVTLTPQQTDTREITFRQTGGIVGPITLSTNIPGVLVRPSTVTLTPAQALQVQAARTPVLQALGRLTGQGQMSPQALTTRVTFSLNDQAVSTYGAMELIASQNGTELGKTTFAVSITAPYVKASFPAGLTLNGYRGATVNLPVTLDPADGFSGPVTVNLTNLPAGVTAAPVAVTILPNASITLNIPVTVSSNASLGSDEFQLQGTRIAKQNVSLLVKPARTLVSETGASNDSLRSAAAGVWVTQSSYVDGKQRMTLRRLVGGEPQVEVTLTDVNQSTIPLPDGTLYVLGAANSDTKTMNVYHVLDDGTYSTVTASSVGLGTGGAADAQGRIWHFVTDTTQTGVIPYRLAYWDPATNKTTMVDSVHSNNYTENTPLVVSNDGRYVLFTGASDAAPVLIDTVTLTTIAIGAAGSTMSQVAVSNNGEVWFTANSKVTRVNKDGTSNTFNLSTTDPFVQVIGFDRQNPQLLWLRGYANAFQVNTGNFQVTPVPTDSIVAAVTLKSGGIGMLTNELGLGGYSKVWLSTLP